MCQNSNFPLSLGNRIMDDFFFLLYSFPKFSKRSLWVCSSWIFQKWCVCVQDMRQTLFVACFNWRSCFTAARCPYSSLGRQSIPSRLGKGPGVTSILMHRKNLGVHRLDKGRSWASPWNTGFKVIAGVEGGQTHKQLETSWKKGIGNLDASLFYF